MGNVPPHEHLTQHRGHGIPPAPTAGQIRRKFFSLIPCPVPEYLVYLGIETNKQKAMYTINHSDDILARTYSSFVACLHDIERHLFATTDDALSVPADVSFLWERTMEAKRCYVGHTNLGGLYIGVNHSPTGTQYYYFLQQ